MKKEYVIPAVSATSIPLSLVICTSNEVIPGEGTKEGGAADLSGAPRRI